MECSGLPDAALSQLYVSAPPPGAPGVRSAEPESLPRDVRSFTYSSSLGRGGPGHFRRFSPETRVTFAYYPPRGVTAVP
eukprot:6150060-Prymnesium_polylepis.1